ncbi:MAG: hypothetical protein D6695_05440 [Planctomycetota bacterium]|nr:MAG: hypothetical protein D6695_05440 [Planctomycetota bacterium]
MSFDVIVSPYHLTTREAPALAALLLCDRVVTMLPTPVGTSAREDAEQLAAGVSRYAQLIESWRWTVELWNAGVLAGESHGTCPGECVRDVHNEIMAGLHWPALGSLLEEHRDERSFVRALAHDLLRGGPDPALTIPVAAGLDRFGARLGLPVARSHPVSLAQRHEQRMWTPLAAVALPVILEGRAERILEARDLLLDELDELRRALSGVFAHDPDIDLREAARAYRQAFDRVADELFEPDEDEIRVVLGEVSLRLVDLPADAALLSSTRAAESITRTRVARDAHAITVAGSRVMALVVRVLARRSI